MINTENLIKELKGKNKTDFKNTVFITNELWGLPLKNKIIEEQIKRGGDHPTLIKYLP